MYGLRVLPESEKALACVPHTDSFNSKTRGILERHDSLRTTALPPNPQAQKPWQAQVPNNMLPYENNTNQWETKKTTNAVKVA